VPPPYEVPPSIPVYDFPPAAAEDAAPPVPAYEAADVRDPVQEPTIAPLAIREQTVHYGRRGRDERSGTQDASRSRWSVATIAAMIVVALAAGAGGYVLFAEGDDGPKPPSASARAAAAKAAATKRAAGRQAAVGTRFSADLGATLRKLDGVRVSERRELAGARTVAGQSRIAARIAEAYRAARTELQRMTPATAQRSAAVLVSDKLRRAADAYAGLAAAAKARSAKRYARAAHAVRVREQAVRRAVAAIPG
jgi:hypothetical protein